MQASRQATRRSAVCTVLRSGSVLHTHRPPPKQTPLFSAFGSLGGPYSGCSLLFQLPLKLCSVRSLLLLSLCICLVPHVTCALCTCLCRLDGDRMAHVSACSLLALLASRVRRVTFSARSTWLSVVLSARSACLPLHAARGLHSRVSRCSSAFAGSRLGRFTLPSRLRVSAVALSAFAITRLGRCAHL